MTRGNDVSEDDRAQLAALGYTSHFDRSMGLWQNFALGFTYLSPVVGAYSLFAFGMATGGPPMIWSYGIAACGMMMICLVFGEVVSQFPISGGVYPWARRLVGRRWSWMTGWIYGWAMYATIAGVAVGSGPFLASLLGMPTTPAAITLVALGILTVSTLLNLLGTRTLARVAMLGFLCEIAGAVVVGGWLLLFHRVQPVAIFVSAPAIPGGGAYLPAFLASTLVGMCCCYGFEACGDLAEETPDPGRAIPRAMRMTIYIGIPVTVVSVAGLMLAVPDMAAVISGKVADPIAMILTDAFGPLGYRLIVMVVMVSFVSCLLSLQAAVSRLVFAYGRDRMIVGGALLARLSPGTHVPVASLILAGVIPSIIVTLGFAVDQVLALILSFAAVGIYLSFQMVVIGAVHARLRGWVPSGKFRLGAWAWPVNILALVYGAAAIVNVLWPRAPVGSAWFVAYAQLLALAGVIGAGLVYLLARRPERHGDAPAADAWMIFGGGRRTTRPMGVRNTALPPLD